MGPRSAAASCTYLPEPQVFNQQRVGETIVIGRLPGRPYRVIIPGADAETLMVVRGCATDAFVSRSRLGDYIQVAASAQRSDAEQIARALRREGLQARVVHLGGLAFF
jgi:hypothetical protein